jgi:hypothetical protein
MTIKIELSRGGVALVDEEDCGLVKGYRWHATNGYARANYQGTSVLMHRLIMRAQTGQMIDHVNGQRADNRRCNLRFCTRAENTRNRKRPVNNSSGFSGVHREAYSGLWRARIQFNNKKINLGNFETPELAHAAYMRAAKEYFGAFAPLKELTV